MVKIISLGEIMLRLSPPDCKRFIQAEEFLLNYGGSELNTTIALNNLGHSTKFLTKLPENPIGDSAIANLKKYGIDTSFILRGGERIGIYYLEKGYSMRSSKVVYDRKNSAFSLSSAEEYDFDKIFLNANIFHLSGITAVLSKECAELSLMAIKKAKENGLLVSFDLNYRKNLWEDDVIEKQKNMSEIIKYVDICFGNPKDATRCLGYADGNDYENMEYLECINPVNMSKMVKKYGLKYLITSYRVGNSANKNNISSICSDGEKYYKSKEYEVEIIDRVGAGDALSAGFLHGILSGENTETSIEYAAISCAFKHSIQGDFNLLNENELREFMDEKNVGVIER